MKNLRVSLQLIFLTLLIFGMLSCSDQKADLVFKGGVIHTVDDANPTAQAIAITGDKILAVGSNSEIETLIGQDTRVVDLAGKTMVPGFVDSHYHFMGVGSREFNLNLDGTTSLPEFVSKVKAAAREKAKGEWITGRGWIEEDWPSKCFQPDMTWIKWRLIIRSCSGGPMDTRSWLIRWLLGLPALPKTQRTPRVGKSFGIGMGRRPAC